MKVYPAFLYIISDRSSRLRRIFRTKEQAEEFCKLPEGERPSGLCVLYYKEWEVEE